MRASPSLNRAGFLRNTQLSKMESRNHTWVVSENDFYSSEEVKRILQHVEHRRRTALKRGAKIRINEWMLINLAFGTGLRVSEMAKLECSDLFLTECFPFIHVRDSKFGKSRTVKIGKKLKDKLKWFLGWKRKIGEDVSDTAPLLLSSNSKNHFSIRGLQALFKRVLARAGIEKRNNIHMTRHTYATALLAANGNGLVFVKDQLGHSSISVTETYLHVVETHAQKALELLYKR